jgi:hypothetical protein
LQRAIFKQGKGSATISLDLSYCSMGASHSLSRDTFPLRLVDVVTVSVHMGVVLASRQLFKLQIKALFKGIVSQNWKGLQMVSLDRFEV